jgi:hypothetical protein
MPNFKTKKKISREQRKMRSYRIIFVVISVVVLATMLLSLVAR